MSSDRLRQVEEHLELLQEQQGSLEREILLTTGLAKTQAEQRLRLEIKPRTYATVTCDRQPDLC